MILNARGEQMRREIGFLRAMTRVSQVKTEVSTQLCGYSIPVEGDETEEAKQPEQ
ncbi:MAG: hypothetical protein V4502_08025 [Pseudomonadota bacterium]